MPETRTVAADTFIREQHQLIRELITGLRDAAPSDRAEVWEPLVRLLAVHETAEELVIYPTIEKQGEEGRAIAAARKAEEDRAKKALADLEKLDPATSEFMSAFADVHVEIEAHAAAEEREVLPLLASMNDREDLERMGRLLQLAENMAPTHPHKTAPEGALGNLVVGPFVAMVDRVRDAIRDAGRHDA